jgi:D-aminopeptidase
MRFHPERIAPKRALAHTCVKSAKDQTMIAPGPKNLITDIAGLKVGNADDADLKSGVTVLTGDAPFTAGVHIMGGAPGTRETDLLAPDKTVQQVDALVLSGGSAFGLDAASGVMAALKADGRGFPVGPHLVPIVPAAILFDLANGGNKNWGENPYVAIGARAYSNAATTFEIGTQGAGTGATSATLKGGLGSASLVLPSGHIVGALIAANPVGSTTISDTKHFWAAPNEFGDEFGGFGTTPNNPGAIPPSKLDPKSATTIGIVATDATLDKAACTRLATAAHDGFARAIWPAHTPFDGDLIFAASTGVKPLQDSVADPMLIGHAAAICVARAIARAIYAASAAPNDTLPTWSDCFGK